MEVYLNFILFFKKKNGWRREKETASYIYVTIIDKGYEAHVMGQINNKTREIFVKFVIVAHELKPEVYMRKYD
jgi:hypothetical protein